MSTLEAGAGSAWRRDAWRAGSLAALVVVLGWWLAPSLPEAPSLVQARRDEWVADLLPRRADGASLAARLMASNLWGEVAQLKPAETPPPPDERWRLAAVVNQGAQRFALLTFADESKPPVRLRVGDKLPGGQTITSIDDREICVRIGQRSYRLGIERIEN